MTGFRSIRYTDSFFVLLAKRVRGRESSARPAALQWRQMVIFLSLISITSEYSRQWGATGGTGVWAGEFNYPTDVAIAADNTLYVADGYNDRVQAFSPNDEFIHKWGGPLAMNIFGSFNGWFAAVTGISVGPEGNVFVADYYNDRVQKFKPNGGFLNAFGVPTSEPTHTAIAVAVAADGTVFVADYANHQIQKWWPGE